MAEPNLCCDTGTAEDYVTEENARLRKALTHVATQYHYSGDHPMAISDCYDPCCKQSREALSSPVEKVVDGEH